MNWRLKCAAFKLFEAMPLSNSAHRLAQRLVTGRYRFKVTETRLKTYSIPVAQFSAIKDAAVALEFGASGAPGDARHTGLPDGNVNLIYSTAA